MKASTPHGYTRTPASSTHSRRAASTALARVHAPRRQPVARPASFTSRNGPSGAPRAKQTPGRARAAARVRRRGGVLLHEVARQRRAAEPDVAERAVRRRWAVWVRGWNCRRRRRASPLRPPRPHAWQLRVPPLERTDATVRSARATAAPDGVTIIAPASKQSSRARTSAANAWLCTMAKVRGRLFLHTASSSWASSVPALRGLRRLSEGCALLQGRH